MAKESKPEIVFNDQRIEVGALWFDKSPLSARGKELFKLLVPTQGCAETTRGEALRTVNRIYYDCYNNGGCNSSNGYTLALMDWLELWMDGQVSREVDGDYLALRDVEWIATKLRKIAEAEDKARDEDADIRWDALEDNEYMRKLEYVAHWITNRVDKLQKDAEALALANKT